MGARPSARRPAEEAMVITLPRLRCFVPGRKLFRVKNVASRLPSIVARQPSSGISSSGAGGVKLPPALAMRMSTGPRLSSIWWRIASMWSKLVTSPVTAMALPSSWRMPVTTLLTAASSRPWTAAAAPRRASSVTMASPIPRELPVTRATWPSSVLMPYSFRLRRLPAAGVTSGSTPTSTWHVHPSAGVGGSRALAAAERLVDRLRERPGMGCEALVIPREADRRDAKALGQCQRRQVGHLAVRGVPSAHGDPWRGRPQRGNVGGVADGGRQQMGEEEVGVSLHPGHPLQYLGGHL